MAPGQSVVRFSGSVKANRPDIVVKDSEAKACLLIDMTVPSDRNISLQEHEKTSKYRNL